MDFAGRCEVIQAKSSYFFKKDFYCECFRVVFNPKTDFGFLINILPQALTGCNVWVSWSLFLSFFIGLCSYVAACVADFETNFKEIIQHREVESEDQDRNRVTNALLNELIELHAEVTE